MKIDRFRGQYFFLSNFYPATVSYKGLEYPNNEAAFQAQKVLDINEKLPFTQLSPKDAKRRGRNVKLRSDWEDVKDGVMEEIVRAKFSQNKELGEKLIATGDALLVEGNTWNDRYWGVDFKTGSGHNQLGKIIMKIRAELQQDPDSNYDSSCDIEYTLANFPEYIGQE